MILRPRHLLLHPKELVCELTTIPSTTTEYTTTTWLLICVGWNAVHVLTTTFSTTTNLHHHQAINFVMAGALYMFFGFGRPPANVGVKVASGVIVSIGLYLTTMAPTTPDVGPSGMLDAPV